LIETIAAGIESKDFFGYAAGKESEKYVGFALGEGERNLIHIDRESLIIEKKVVENTNRNCCNKKQ